MNNHSNIINKSMNQPQPKSRICKKYIQHKKSNALNPFESHKQNRQNISDYQKRHSIRNKSNTAIKFTNFHSNNNNSTLDPKIHKSEKELLNHKKENSYEIYNNNNSLLNNKNVPMSERENKKKITKKSKIQNLKQKNNSIKEITNFVQSDDELEDDDEIIINDSDIDIPQNVNKILLNEIKFHTINPFFDTSNNNIKMQNKNNLVNTQRNILLKNSPLNKSSTAQNSYNIYSTSDSMNNNSSNYHKNKNNNNNNNENEYYFSSKSSDQYYHKIKQGSGNTNKKNIQNLFSSICTKNSFDYEKFKKSIKNIIKIEDNKNIIDIQDEDGNSLLHHTCKEGNLNITQKILKYNCNINLQNKKGQTPLHLATREGHENICKLLVDQGANLNIFDYDKNTILHYSYLYNYMELFKYFVSKNPKIKNKNLFNDNIQILNYLENLKRKTSLKEDKTNISMQLPLKKTKTLKINTTPLNNTVDNSTIPKNNCHLKQYSLYKNIKINDLTNNDISNNSINNTTDNVNNKNLLKLENKKNKKKLYLHTNANISKQSNLVKLSSSSIPKKNENLSKNKNNTSSKSKHNFSHFKKLNIIEKSKAESNKNVCDYMNLNNSYENKKINMEKSFIEKLSLKDLECLATLGKGSFGEVYLVRKKNTNQTYAMKVLRKEKIASQNLIKYVLAERNILSLTHHPFIVKLISAFQSSTKLFLILEYCSGGDLSKHLNIEKRFSEKKAKFYLCEIILALEYLHKRNIIFRDLKPDNIVLDEKGHCKLTDFGLSKEGIISNKSTNSFCGSIAYLAPEILSHEGHGKAVDWYLLGVLFYEMLCGITPYFSGDKTKIFYNIQYGELKIPNFISENGKDLIKKLLERNPDMRLGSKNDADEIKEHCYFHNVDWGMVLSKKITPPENNVNFNYCKKFYDKPKQFNVESSELKNTRNLIDGWSFVGDNK